MTLALHRLYHDMIHGFLNRIEWNKKELFMKKSFATARIIIGILTIIVTCIAFVNEDISTRLIGTVIFTITAIVLSFLTTPLSKRMLKYGDKIVNKLYRLFYYLLLVPVLSFVAGILWLFIYNIYDSLQPAQEFSAALGRALWVVFFLAVAVILVWIPYIQALLVLLLRRMQKTEK